MTVRDEQRERADIALILARARRLMAVVECHLLEVLLKLGAETPGAAADHGAAQAAVGAPPKRGHGTQTAPVALSRN